jgi:hypothetical protein
MEVSKEYLKDFCETHGIFSNGYLTSRPKTIISYYFGVPAEKLNENKITSINQLEEIIKNFGEEPSEADKDSNKYFQEISNTLDVFN